MCIKYPEKEKAEAQEGAVSVSGPGGTGSTSWQPDAEPIETPADDTTTPEAPTAPTSRTPTSTGPAPDPAAQALLADLKGIAAKNDAWLPGWLSFLDGSSNVRKLGPMKVGNEA